MLSIFLLSLAALIVGILVGCVGIGGILLPPAVAYVGGLNLHLAMATSMWSFLFVGIVGTIAYARDRSINWRMVGWLSISVIPAAMVGALVNVVLSAGMLMLILAILIVVAGINSLSRSKTIESAARHFSVPTLIFIGAIVGFGSALTGTGGPILLVPLLLFLRSPILASVGAAQAVTIPVSIFATTGYVFFSEVDFALGTILGIIAALGVAVGSRIAHRTNTATLQSAVAISLILIGFLIILRTIFDF